MVVLIELKRVVSSSPESTFLFSPNPIEYWPSLDLYKPNLAALPPPMPNKIVSWSIFLNSNQ